MRTSNAEYMGAAMCGLADDFSDFMSKVESGVGSVSKVISAGAPALQQVGNFVSTVRQGGASAQQVQQYNPMQQIQSTLGPAKNYAIPAALAAVVGLGVLYMIMKKKGRK